MKSETNDIQKILDICNQLVIIEPKLNADDIEIGRFKNGFMSEVRRVELKRQSSSFEKYVPRSFVIKFFNTEQTFEEAVFDILTSQLNSLVIGNAGIGPKVYMIRNDCVVMEALNAETLTAEHEKDFNIRKKIATNLARFHALSVPIKRWKPLENIHNVLIEWQESSQIINTLYSDPLKSEYERRNLETFFQRNLKTEIDYVLNKITISDQNSTIVFTHGDFNHLNLLVDSQSSDVKFIDFDYSNYSYRGTDLGRYFVDCAQPEQFHSNDLIADDEMIQFLQWYHQESCLIHGEEYANDERNSVECLWNEAKLFAMFSFMVDVIFCIYMANEKFKLNNVEQMESFLLLSDQRYQGYLKYRKRFFPQ